MLKRKLDAPRSRYLVFTSAGDHSSVHRWVRGKCEFDLWIVYYGDRPGRFEQMADYYEERKDGKFPNLHHAYSTAADLIARYEAVLVADDDLSLSARHINRLFEIREQHDLWVLEPAHSPLGTISLDINRFRPECLLRFTNFVEQSYPLFRRDRLDEFMQVYDPVMKGDAIEWWFLHVLCGGSGETLRGRVAIADEVPCVNPLPFFRGGREIKRLLPPDMGRSVWNEIRIRHGIRIHEDGKREYGRIERSKLDPGRWTRVVLYTLVWKLRSLALRLLGQQPPR